MTLPRLAAFNKVWKAHPPKQVLLEIAARWKPPERGSFDDLFAIAESGGKI